MSAPGSGLSLLRPLFRLASAAIMVQGFRNIGNLQIDIVIRNQYGGHLQYLTMQGLAFAVLTMLIGATMDLIPPLKPLLRGIRRCFFIAAMPLAVIISSIYWTLLLLFPHLIIDPRAGPGNPSTPSSSEIAPPPFRLPLSVDFPLHAVPAISLLVDFLAFEPKYRRKEVNIGVPLVVGLYACFYGAWVEHCAARNDGVFPYPFLTQSPFEVRVVIYAGAALLAILSFRILNRIHPRATVVSA
ncbi:hypothetical protein FA15DRAFT_663107 [Coprinopsis marcescibilis]|uniref:FAR-17a/AIG1-like protein n=1 Tax=Coprinopsis marcescibilis TaxID=230819 RepID=A0A5C3LB38_COPMA|nr:hypothetical protein FA15DRAFT_663107 [Coprinopsis marcescibilis]